MRMALLLVASALLAGCSGGMPQDRESITAVTTPSTTRTTTTTVRPPTTTPRAAPPSAAPASGAAMADVISWVEAGRVADPAGYRSMTRDGVSTPLGDQVAFTTAGAETNCVTDRYEDGALACLVKLTNPPPRPPDFPTAWKNNWVDFDGTTVDVGSPHGDPGPFVDGTGAELPAGQSLAFGDYRCRADASGLYCVDYAHQSAVRLSANGIDAFGCLEKATPPADIGIRFAC